MRRAEDRAQRPRGWSLPEAPRPPALRQPLKADAARAPAEAHLAVGPWVPDTELTQNANVPFSLPHMRLSTDIFVAFLTKSAEA